MAVEKGDLIKIEYSAYLKASGQLIDTTDERKAKENGLFDEKKKYGPVIINVGAGDVLKGVEGGVVGLNEGETKELEIQPQDAFGQRDDNLVRIIPVSQFRKANINPTPGQVINIDNMPATVKAVNSGRVVVDFNHPLAGAILRYEIKVLKDAKTLEEKAKLLIEKYEMKCDVKVNGENVELDLKTSKYDEKRARDSAAIALVAKELKELGAKKASFKGEWEF